MYIITDFEKTLVWLMDAYPESMYKLKPELAKDIFNRITIKKEIIDAIMSDNSSTVLSDDMQKIINIFLFLADFRQKLNDVKGRVISYDDAECLYQNMILLNSEMTQFFIEEAQRQGSFSYDTAYSQSDVIMAYISIICKDMKKREKLQKIYPKQDFLGTHCLQIVSEFDWLVLATHLEYLTLINTLMCIKISPFYADKQKTIAEWFLKCFGNTLSNCRIDEMYMEPNTYFSEDEKGPRTTTKLEIFFSQSNGDRYQLRLDFPHDDKNYIHFNLYEPFFETAYPIGISEYDSLVKKYGVIVKDLFYRCGNRMWFKSNFIERISSFKNARSDLYDEVMSLFEANTHVYVCDCHITEDDMKEFLSGLFSAISIMDMEYSKYIKPKLVDERKRLEHITLIKNVREAAYKIDEAYTYNVSIGKIPVELEVELVHIECKLIEVLTDYFGKYKIEELSNLTAVELLELVKGCMDDENP